MAGFIVAHCAAMAPMCAHQLSARQDFGWVVFAAAVIFACFGVVPLRAMWCFAAL